VADPVLRLENLRRSFGGLVVTDDVTLDVLPGELHAIIGPNGAGKTTLINQISGLLASDAGRIFFSGRDTTHCLRMRAPAWDWHDRSRSARFCPASP
jgi:branched-chain amino acid transport system ATP-binding protein